MDSEDNVLPCAEKIAFDTKKDAQTAATVAEYQHSVKLKPYKCAHCNLWHLASD